MTERREFTRRDFLRLSSIATASAILAACAPAAAPKPPPAEEVKEKVVEKPAEVKEPVTLEYWFCWSGRYADIQRNYVLDPFEKQFEGRIKIHDLPVPSNIKQKLLTAVAAGEGPDVANCFGDLNSLAAEGAFMAIDDYVAASDIIELDAIYQAALKACYWRGSLYGFPYNCSSELLLFNRQLFEEAGLDPEKCPETWEEFTEISKKLVEFDDAGNLARAAYTTWFPRHLPLWFWINGGDAYNTDTGELTINTPRNVEGMQTVIDYAWEVYGDVAKADEFVAGAGSAAEGPFCTGTQAMVYAGDWDPSTYHEWCPEVKIWPCYFPKAPQGDKPVATYAGDYIGILRGAKYPDHAYEFIEWMVMTGNLLWTKAGVDTNCLGRDAGVVREDWPDIFGDRAAEIAKWWAQAAVLAKPVQHFPAYAFMNDELARVFDLAIHKQMTVQEALDEAQANTLEEMDKYVVPGE